VKLPTKITEYPPPVTQAGRYTILSVKGPVETRYGQSLIAVVTNNKGEERSLFIPYDPVENSNQSSQGRLTEAFSDETDH